jgi:hypothetical protein
MNGPKRSAPGTGIAGAAKLRRAQNNSGLAIAQHVCRHDTPRGRELRALQSRVRNGIDLTIFSHSAANGAPTPRHSEHRNQEQHSQN